MGSAAWTKSADDVQKSAQLLLSSLLPLFGTWVGTVLAFYYSKENFESASRGTLDAVRSAMQRLSATRVTDGMMPRAKMKVLQLPAGGRLEDVTVAAVKVLFDERGENGQRISRLPVLDASDACLGFLHRGLWNEMLAGAAQPFDPATGKLGALVGAPNPLRDGETYADAIRRSITFVASSATVADAKAAMEAVRGCQDVIVTASGARDSGVLGWISNIDIGRLSQA